jgi:phosphoribosylformylglycinamidine synthase
MAALDNFCWPDPIESAQTPDGAHKLAQLVRACEGLYDACVAYGLPLVSGKDSMKNDAKLGGVKISVPPTLLVSVIGQMQDVRRAISLAPRAPGDVLYVLGETKDELGGSELERMLGRPLGAVPKTDLARAADRYRAFCAARDEGLVRSAHVTSRGGLAVALAHLAMASELGVSVDLESLGSSPQIASFSESTGRIVFTASPKDAAALESRLASHGLVLIGAIEPPREGRGFLRLREGERLCADLGTSELRRAFQEENHAV